MLHSYNVYSPRLRRVVVLCGIALLVALFLGRTELQGSPTGSLQNPSARIVARSESIVLDIQSSNETATRVYKRDPLTEEEWQKATKAGGSFVTCVLKAKRPKDAGYPKQSIWLDPDDLEENGVRAIPLNNPYVGGSVDSWAYIVFLTHLFVILRIPSSKYIFQMRGIDMGMLKASNSICTIRMEILGAACSEFKWSMC